MSGLRSSRSEGMTMVQPSAQKSAAMASIRTRRTKPELRVRTVLRSMHVSFRGNVETLPGCPDLVIRQARVAILIHGCFWHHHRNCPKGKLPRTNRSFWKSKIRANVVRDSRDTRRLKVGGWRVVVVWECETYDPERLARTLKTLSKKPDKKVLTPNHQRLLKSV